MYNFIEKDFGILFYNEQNKQSYDSNHALIYKDKIKDLEQVLDFITEFYSRMNIKPNIYQATEDEGYFKENEAIFNSHGYSVWIEGPNNFMILTAADLIIYLSPNIIETRDLQESFFPMLRIFAERTILKTVFNGRHIKPQKGFAMRQVSGIFFMQKQDVLHIMQSKHCFDSHFS